MQCTIFCNYYIQRIWALQTCFPSMFDVSRILKLCWSLSLLRPSVILQTVFCSKENHFLFFSVLIWFPFQELCEQHHNHHGETYFQSWLNECLELYFLVCWRWHLTIHVSVQYISLVLSNTQNIEKIYQSLRWSHKSFFWKHSFGSFLKISNGGPLDATSHTFLLIVKVTIINITIVNHLHHHHRHHRRSSCTQRHVAQMPPGGAKRSPSKSQ